MEASRFWADYTAADIEALNKEALVVVLPIAATEQHGPHLPLSVDTTIVDGFIARTAPKIPAAQSVLFLPTLCIGKSNEHSAFPGTLTFSAQTLMALWMEIVDSIVRAGVKRFLFLNSHGGQMNLMDVVTRDIRVKHSIIAVAANWYTLGLPKGMIDDEELRHGIHGGEVETSLMLALKPSAVKMHLAQNFQGRTHDYARDFKFLSITNTGKIGWQMQDLHACGAAGNAANATAEKGEQILEFVSDRLVELLAEVARVPMTVLREHPTLLR
jgi:creatinine amidohydrolase